MISIIDELFNVEYQPPVKINRGIEQEDIMRYSYKTNPPFEPSQISNKARVCPRRLYGVHIPPQNINDSIKPENERFKYFKKPVQSFQSSEYLGLLLQDNSTVYNTTDGRTLESFNIEFKSLNNNPKDGPLYVPPEVYTYNWSYYNRQYIVNKCKKQGSLIATPLPVYDPTVMNMLKMLYPTANEKLLKMNYEQLITKHGLDKTITTQPIDQTEKSIY
jgi:hypothetical protein